MRFSGLKSALATSVFSLVLPLVSANAHAQQVTYYDFDGLAANPSLVSNSCSTAVPAGTLFCFNDGTGANIYPSFLSDTYPSIIDPVVVPNTPPAPSTHTSLETSPAAQNQSSSLWFTVPQKVTSGFTSYFAFKFTPDLSSFGTADGIAFVIQNSTNPGWGGVCLGSGTGLGAIGGDGGCMGFGGIDNSLAIELDTYQDNWDPTDIPSNPVNDNHISIQNCGAGLPNSPVIIGGDAGSCEVTLNPAANQIAGFGIPPGVTMADGNVHQVVVEYSGPNEATPHLLQIWVDPPFVTGTHTPVKGATPTITGIYDIGANLNLINSGSANDSAYVGFTSATGGSDEQQQLMAWTFTPHTTVTLTEPLSGPGMPTTFPFGTHTLTVTYPSNGPSTTGIDMTVTANTISPTLFTSLVAGGPFSGSSCQIYDDTGGNCIVYSVSCEVASSGALTPCPPTTPSNPITIKTAYNNSIAPISPGFIQGDPFFTQVTSIVGNGTTATVTCVGECAVTAGQQITVEQSSVAGFNGPVTVTSVSSPGVFTYASAATGTGTGGFLTSNNLQNVFVSYIPQRVDGSTTGKLHSYSDFVATSVTAAPTMLSISAPTAAYGAAAPVAVTATSGNGAPTGNILLSVDGKTPITVPLSAGVATFNLTGLNAGSHSLKATYVLTGVFQGAVQTGSILITQISPTVTFTGAPQSAPYKSTFTIAATTTASTKAVIKAAGSCTLSGTTVTITSGIGTCNLSATWAGDVNYLPTSLTQTTTAVPEATQINVTSQTANPVNLQSPVVLGFSVTGTPVTPTGKYTVTSSVPGDPSCAANLASLGTGTCTLNFSTPGTRFLTVSYLGVTNYIAATSLPQVEVDVTSVPLASTYPTSVAFGSQYLGVTYTRTVVVTNAGSAPMTVTNATVADLNNGNPTNYVAINTCPASPATIAVGQSCTVYVTFVAGPANSTPTGTLQITGNGANLPLSVPLSATVLGPQLTLAPSPVVFGAVGVGSTNSIAVTLTNGSTSTISAPRLSVSGSGANQFSLTNNTCTATLAVVSGSCSVTVNFNPTLAGTYGVYLTAIDSAGGGVQQVPVTGTAQ